MRARYQRLLLRSTLHLFPALRGVAHSNACTPYTFHLEVVTQRVPTQSILSRVQVYAPCHSLKWALIDDQIMVLGPL
ncbi:hypothetical protein BC939DRAFT_464510 [Gamsiella multidivaricata]|uniref:uncharacterized protein n=1 Tax=Gamsiella multidivaricata TaxID=101098 RepID=UPI00221E3F03|nr:uncharacterized protein BC939DRAFT_464510 [Gamsiella multidivaricata]KAI7817928.1 hypothetical protein BC939DRAFT_464510 [Gamsiella multidivaricata]